MFHRLPLIVVALLAPASVFAGPNTSTPGEDKPEVDGKERPRREFVWVDPVKDLAADAVASDHIAKIIYVNGCWDGGCTIKPGTNDARANSSSIVSDTSFISAFPHSQQIWDDTIACIKEVYSPYDVEIVTEDPGPETFHHEAILTGHPSDIGLADMIGGIAPSSCTPLNNVISFSFAGGPLGTDVEEMCWTVAQESAHSFGLPNHVYNCLDPMTYLPNIPGGGACGRKFFRNQAFPCGEFAGPEPCNCSGATQNSHIELRAVFGDGTAPPAPELEILLPANDAAVLDNFAVYWETSDTRLLDRSELWINGTKYREISGGDFPQEVQFDTTVPDLPDGNMNVEIKAYNELGSESVASVKVVKGSPCTTPDTCFEFQECVEGGCTYPAPTANLGDGCDIDQQCVEGVCASVDGSKSCAVSCNINVDGACVEGFTCTASETGGAVCAVSSEDSGGCCSVAGTKRDPIPWFAVVFAVFGLLVIRRRAKS